MVFAGGKVGKFNRFLECAWVIDSIDAFLDAAQKLPPDFIDEFFRFRNLRRQLHETFHQTTHYRPRHRA